MVRVCGGGPIGRSDRWWSVFSVSMGKGVRGVAANTLKVWVGVAGQLR